MKENDRLNICEEIINNCDRYSRSYCKSFNTLQPILMPNKKQIGQEHVIVSLDSMDDFDRSALGLYIGKFVEQEINSSIVQLMRNYCGIKMPDFYCKRDSKFYSKAAQNSLRNDNVWPKDVVETRHKKIKLNETRNQTNRESLKTIPLGDAFYCLQELKDENAAASKFFKEYPFLYEPRFLEVWRRLIIFRNNVAHTGELIDYDELLKAYNDFNEFLEYMPKIQNIKETLALNDYYENDESENPQKESNQTMEYTQNDNNTSRATVQAYKKFLCLKDTEQYEELNELISKYNWFTRVFADQDGKKGMVDPGGNILVPAEYDDFGFTYDVTSREWPVVIAIKNGKYGLVKTDGSGEEVTKFEYDNIQTFEWTNWFVYQKGGSKSFGILSTFGKEITPCIIDQIYYPENAGVIFQSGEYYGIWHYRSGVLLMPMFDNIEIYDLDEYPIVFTLNNVDGFIDYEGKFTPKSVLDKIEDEDERLEKLYKFIYMQYS